MVSRLYNPNNNRSDLNIAEWCLFGYREQVTKQSVLHDGQLTLTKNLTVPSIGPSVTNTRHAVPKRHKLVLEFDTSTNPTSLTTVRDTSEMGNDGTLIGDAYYSIGDKAFKFDGSDYIQTGNGIVSGNPTISQSLWFKYTGSGVETLYTISAGYGTNTTFWVYVSGDVLYVDFSANSVSFTDPNTGSSAIGPNQWYHLVVTYNGNSTIGGRRCYINGVEQVSSAVSGSAANGTLSLGSSRVTLGALDYTATSGLHQMVGCISNFKLYNTALTAGDVKTLYDMGRGDSYHVTNFQNTLVGINCLLYTSPSPRDRG